MFTMKAVNMVELQDRVDVVVPLAVRIALAELSGLQFRPAGTVSVRAIVPAKLNRLVNVIVEVIREPGAPWGDIVRMEKSPT
jgi:hypothetical protein